MPIGVLALQGDFREHISTLTSLGVDSIEVRTVSDMEKSTGLIIPGGESTAIQKLAMNFGLLEPIRSAIRDGLPTFGTCAGLIMLADEILDGISGQVGFGGLDISVRRNAFGNQLESFETQLTFEGISGSKIEAAFIRAPIVERVGEGVQILSKLDDGRVVAVRNETILGISFHPEISGEKRVHEYFVGMIS
ncbi:MAG: pyridoxal 5'-phosphate synthase glutaminase subunit PdxT [Actinobacteria bacterium]|jgi:5'-phosphate synthase pdxT subunit|uniref:glutaminase n=1 Tax=freshwater metagenome TaxID=449393 RepID=A0A6J6D9F0_9ZZZZ|nr:pyridoxal 5'-phosphate synthase glutaminase subunit PdxT [Actinomycetota bacterium]